MKYLVVTLLVISLIFIGCQDKPKDYGVNFWYAERLYLINGIPILRMMVNNNTDKPLHNVWCIGTAKDKTGKVLDTAIAVFNNGGRVEQWETVIADGLFLDLKSHKDYASLDFEVGYDKN